MNDGTRKEFEMPDHDHVVLMDACKPVVCMKIGEYVPRSPQENANDAWAALGRKMDFNHLTVRPVSGKSDHFFTAESTVTL